MADINVLSEADIRLLKDHIAKLKNIRQNPQIRRKEDDPDLPTPEVFIASTPDSGIPALSGYTPGGGVECNLYQFVEGGGNTIEYLGVSHIVYNLGTSDIPGDTWILVAKDKFGIWFAVGTPQTTDCDDITFTETEAYCVDPLGTSNEVWFRSRTITLSTVDGCLVKTASAWVDLDCLPPGTATATATATTDTGTATDSAHCCGGHGFGLLPDTLTVTWSSFVNCSCLNPLSTGLTSISWLSGNTWTGVDTYDGMKTMTITLSCDGSGVWTLSWIADDMGITLGSGTPTASPSSCTPFSQTFSLDVTGVCSGSAASVVATITL